MTGTFLLRRERRHALQCSAYVASQYRRARDSIVPAGMPFDEAKKLVEPIALGTFLGLKRYFDPLLLGGKSDNVLGGGGGIIQASYGGGSGTVRGGSDIGGHSEAAGLPSIRYGRSGIGKDYRDTPHRSGTVKGGTDLRRGSLPSDMPPTQLGRTGSKFAGKAPAIMRGLMDRYGLTQEQAAGVLGNLGHESAGFTAYQEKNPTRGAGGVGWAQWTGVRRTAFLKWVAQHPGMDPKSDEASWRYLTEGDPEMPGAIAAVKRTNNRRDAVRAFHDHFERSGDIHHGVIVKPRHWNSRLDYADKAFALGPSAPQAPAYADEGRRGFGAAAQREAERAVLPRPRPDLLPRPERQIPVGPRIEAMTHGIGFDHSGLDEAIAKVDTLHAKLQGLRSTASVDINHRHRHEGDPGDRPGKLRTALNGGYASDGRPWT